MLAVSVLQKVINRPACAPGSPPGACFFMLSTVST